MKHFSYLNEEQKEKVFFKFPKNFSKKSSKDILERALGAALYMPATKKNIAEILIEGSILGLASVVLCLEDAIGDNEVDLAEENLFKNLKKLKEMNVKIEKELPIIFIRIRNPEHLINLKKQFGEVLDIISGFVLPKFDSKNAVIYLENIIKISTETKFYAMPILETERVIDKISRYDELQQLLIILRKYRDIILNLRVGATDLSGLFGLRRNPDTTIYNIMVIRDFLGDVINYFKRDDFIISGVVWEYFQNTKENNRILKPQLRQTPFLENFGTKGMETRKLLLDEYTDGLLREVVMDKVNGFFGKTIIHPSHVIPVQSMYVVTHEEYLDAKEIIKKNNGEMGVFKSDYSNKMNEIKPHLKWATEIIKRAEIYGVFKENENYTSLFI
ncbi:MAG: hypothetical protein B6I28_03735 [Fusobacteriia bacterium 4572_132]|nr:MAG: hypothetical protein B6I28_03735 [Fusobacteriia bacterium 4572_132]